MVSPPISVLAMIKEAEAMGVELSDYHWASGDRTSHVTVISIAKHEAAIAELEARMTMLLSLIDPAELKRVKLLPPEHEGDTLDAWDRNVSMAELGKRTEQFKKAHDRLTRQPPELKAGRVDIEPHEMSLIAELRARGCSASQILNELKIRRKQSARP